MDNLDYEYDDHSNRLLKVTDSSGSNFRLLPLSTPVYKYF